MKPKADKGEEGVKPYTCDQCAKSFSSIASAEEVMPIQNTG